MKKSDAKKFDALIDELEGLGGKLSDVATRYNETVQKAWEEFQEALYFYHEHLDDVKAWVEEYAATLAEEYGSRSERWRESDKGQAFQAFVEEWSTFHLDEIESDEPEMIDIEGELHAEELRTLQRVPSDTEVPILPFRRLEWLGS